jgi:chromosome segregation protein
MYLKALTVLGFKSFADKTTLQFQPGVTAIVGPNGCGKSNVSDAIRWVLGEQSAKALRGGEMADVIFNGTDSRKPLGMAEVSLTLGEVDTAQLRAAGVNVDFNELTVTRRVYRDGGSEYFVNKVSCRLRDLQQLFAGTGVGKSSYSVMAQGNITQILSSKPDDRRLVFEEAAGITRFKSQKKEALRKLEHTDANLLRVQDLIKEVKRQLGSLQRQAGKARRYKNIATELQHLETQLARHQLDVLIREIASRQADRDQLHSVLEAGQLAVTRWEDEWQRLRADLTDLEQKAAAGRQRATELKAETDQQTNRAFFNSERLQELETQNARAVADIAQAQDRQRISEEELRQVQERVAEAQASVQRLRQQLEEKRQGLVEVERDLQLRHEAQRAAQSRAFGTAQQLSRVRNEIQQLNLQIQGNAIRLEKLNAERGSLQEESLRVEARLNEFSAQVETEKLQVTTSRGTLEERQARIRGLQQEIQATQQTLDQALRRQAEARSRLSLLEQLDTQHEGFGAGALAALRQSSLVSGSLVDHLRVTPEYVTAIEAALGNQLQVVLSQQPESARQILDDLSSQKKGRATIAALSLIPLESQSENSSEPFPSEGTRALSVVECDETVRGLITALLGRTVIVPDLAAATAAFRAASGAFDFVTLTGDLLTRGGLFTGGQAAPSGKAPASILGRKNQIAELRGELARVVEEVTEFSRVRGAHQAELSGLQASLEQARQELRTQEVAVATRQGELKALEQSRRLLSQKIETTGYELKTLTTYETEGAEKRVRLAGQLADLEQKETAAAAEVQEINTSIETLRQRRDAANAALGDVKVALATDEQLLASHGRQRLPLEARLRELASLIQRQFTETSSYSSRKSQFEAEVQSAREQVERLNHLRTVVGEEIAVLSNAIRATEAEIGIREAALKEERSRLQVAQIRRGELEVELTQKAMTAQNLRERIQSKYQLVLDEVRGEGLKITIADEGQPKIETVSPEELAEAGLSTDWDEVAAQVGALQRRMDEIGPVNLVAIDEFEETEQRHKFLTAQHDDLQSAKQQLVEVISKINGETRSMFMETFEKIRDNFRTLFVEVFGGGKADLQLVEGEDVLEAGIEIMARPPGKQLQSIALLSGGEQTMTAVALLFSIYQVKPSPFCVLDELDAPLDESNINRFVKVLKRFIDHSQFIVITHNKRTIGMADVLYGVTMQEQGVSKIVSVRFNREEGAPESKTETPSRLEPPPTEGVDAPRSIPSADSINLQNGRHPEAERPTSSNEVVVSVDAQNSAPETNSDMPTSDGPNPNSDDDQQVIMAK